MRVLHSGFGVYCNYKTETTKPHYVCLKGEIKNVYLLYESWEQIRRIYPEMENWRNISHYLESKSVHTPPFPPPNVSPQLGLNIYHCMLFFNVPPVWRPSINWCWSLYWYCSLPASSKVTRHFCDSCCHVGAWATDFPVIALGCKLAMH